MPNKVATTLLSLFGLEGPTADVPARLEKAREAVRTIEAEVKSLAEVGHAHGAVEERKKYLAARDRLRIAKEDVERLEEADRVRKERLAAEAEAKAERQRILDWLKFDGEADKLRDHDGEIDRTVDRLGALIKARHPLAAAVVAAAPARSVGGLNLGEVFHRLWQRPYDARMRRNGLRPGGAPWKEVESCAESTHNFRRQALEAAGVTPDMLRAAEVEGKTGE